MATLIVMTAILARIGDKLCNLMWSHHTRPKYQDKTEILLS